ncbi:hypothetical protein WA026_006992 [Henosepilachna vigintioctopunctata]|uniref:Caspase Dronc n=1 Tax=Henosepilachna vigintioctopunctata TaxID=420089 RepID=A0AAW1V870_9CUCU
MHQRYRDKIKQHFVELVDRIEADVLVDFLMHKRALKKEEVDKIFVDSTDFKHTNRLLLFRILKKKDNVYHLFVEGLELFKLKHLFMNSGYGNRTRTATVFHEPCTLPIEDLSNLSLNSSNTIESPELSRKFSEERKLLEVNVRLAEKFLDIDIECIYDTTNQQRGQVLIINNDRFNPKYNYNRRGSNIDLRCLIDLFSQMHMKVEFHENISVKRMKEVVQKFSEFDMKRISDICIVVIMSHGKEKVNRLVVLDEENESLETSWIEEQFSNVNCTLFSGKPKVFLYQICRGKQFDYATTRHNDMNENNIELKASNNVEKQYLEDDVQVDSGCISVIERRLEDMLLGYATQSGHRAHRDPQFGSWYIQTICEVFMKKAYNTDIVQMLNEVDRNLKDFSTDNYTIQTSSYTSNGFNKLLYFNPGIYKDNSGNVMKFQ